MTLSGKFGFLKGNPIKSLASSSKESFLASINNEKRLFEELKKLIPNLEKTSDEYDYSDAVDKTLSLRMELKTIFVLKISIGQIIL